MLPTQFQISAARVAVLPPNPPRAGGPCPAVRPETPATTGREGEDAIVKRSAFSVHLAGTPSQHRQAKALVDRMYAWRGYRRENVPGVSDSPQAASPAVPTHTTLLAQHGAQALGTLTLNIDNGGGLLADRLYHREIDAYRQGGKRVCELTGFAITPRTGSRELLAALFHLLYIAGRRLYRASDVFIEVNPRHVAFYRGQLGFREAGESRMCERVQAPATLLHARIDYMAAQIACHAGRHDSSRRSLYPYFFTRPEEEEFGRRLLAAKALGRHQEAERHKAGRAETERSAILLNRPGAGHQAPASARRAVPA